MIEAISPQRLAEIRENDRLDRQRGSVTSSMVADIADHRTELLAEVDRLAVRVAALEAEREQLATNILGLKRYYDDNVHARFALGYAADLARGTKLELRDAAAPDRSDRSGQ